VKYPRTLYVDDLPLGESVIESVKRGQSLAEGSLGDLPRGGKVRRRPTGRVLKRSSRVDPSLVHQERALTQQLGKVGGINRRVAFTRVLVIRSYHNVSVDLGTFETGVMEKASKTGKNQTFDVPNRAETIQL